MVTIDFHLLIQPIDRNLSIIIDFFQLYRLTIEGRISSIGHVVIPVLVKHIIFILDKKATFRGPSRKINLMITLIISYAYL